MISQYVYKYELPYSFHCNGHRVSSVDITRLFSSQPKKPQFHSRYGQKVFHFTNASRQVQRLAVLLFSGFQGAFSLDESNQVVRQNNHFYPSLGLSVSVAMTSTTYVPSCTLLKMEVSCLTLCTTSARRFIAYANTVFT